MWATSFVSANLTAGQYCVLVEACTRPTHATDGALMMESRCRNATSAPMAYDNTPPSAVVGSFEVVNASEDVWPRQSAIACEDVESGISQAHLSLGTIQDPGRFLSAFALNVSVLPDANGTISVSQPNVTGVDGALCLPASEFRLSLFCTLLVPGVVISSANASGFWGVIVISHSLFEVRLWPIWQLGHF